MRVQVCWGYVGVADDLQLNEGGVETLGRSFGNFMNFVYIMHRTFSGTAMCSTLLYNFEGSSGTEPEIPNGLYLATS